MRDAVRAGLVLLAGLVVLIGALPMPGPASHRVRDDPKTLAEAETWSDLLGSVGVQVSARWLVDGVYVLGRTARDARGAVLGPVAPILRFTGTRQGWGLFAYPRDRPYRLVVAQRAGVGGQRVLYQPHDPDRAWQGRWIAHRRIRASLTPNRGRPRAFYALSDALIHRAFHDHPGAEQVEVRLEQIAVTPPPEPTRRELGVRYVRRRSRPSSPSDP